MGAAFSCTGEASLPDVFIDVTNAESHDQREESVCNNINSECISKSVTLLDRFAQYKDAKEFIRSAISMSTPENQDAAWNVVRPNVEFQSELFEFSLCVCTSFENLTNFFIQKANGRANDIIEQVPLAAKTFSELFNIICSFDRMLLQNPDLLGDLSFFRRTANRRSDFDQYDQLFAKSGDMAMFFASPNPLLNKCIARLRMTAAFPQEVSKMLDLFGALCDAFTSSQISHKFDDEEINVRYYNSMFSCIFIYDSLAGTGAFHSKAGIHTLDAVEVLNSASPRQTQLLNIIKNSCTHYKDPTTNKQITAIIN